MSESRRNFFVLTGASGSGKSAIVAELKRRGHVCVEEIGRQVVREQIRTGSDGTPWQDHAKFMELLLSRSVAAYQSVQEESRPIFFDRGIPECLWYARSLEGRAGEERLRVIADCRYNRTVFMTPPWQEIYSTDSERRHTFQQGLDYHREEIAAYIETGYELLEVPRFSVEERADFILEYALGNFA